MEYIAHSSRYEQMQYRRCGKSGLKLPEISLGLWHNFGFTDRFDVARQIVLKAFDRGIKYLVSSLDQSLKRMKLDYVDIFYSHRPDPDTPLEETMAALDLIVKQGKALYAGISNYPADLTQKATQILKQMGTPCLIHQPSYSMFNRWAENGLMEVLEQEGMGCITFSPLAQGLLTDRYLKGIPADSRAANSLVAKR